MICRIQLCCRALTGGQVPPSRKSSLLPRSGPLRNRCRRTCSCDRRCRRETRLAYAFPNLTSAVDLPPSRRSRRAKPTRWRTCAASREVLAAKSKVAAGPAIRKSLPRQPWLMCDNLWCGAADCNLVGATPLSGCGEIKPGVEVANKSDADGMTRRRWQKVHQASRPSFPAAVSVLQQEQSPTESVLFLFVYIRGRKPIGHRCKRIGTPGQLRQNWL